MPLLSERGVQCDSEDLPVGFTVVNHGVGAKDSDRDNITSISLDVGELADINRVVVTKLASGVVLVGWVLPRLQHEKGTKKTLGVAT